MAVGLLTGGRTQAAVGLFSAPWDKLAHIATFATAFVLMAVALQVRSIRTLWLPLLGTLVLAAADELQQGALPGRHSDWHDFLADAAGALIGLWLMIRLRRGPRRPDSPHSQVPNQ